MNRYLMAVWHFFREYENFEVEANSKEEAIQVGKAKVKSDWHYCHGGNYDLENVICIKKLKPKKK